MKSIKNTRKGMTLAEIMVGLALVSVMITLVVSFVFMMTERNRVNRANDEILQDVKKIEAVVEGWVESMTGENAALSSVATSGNTEVRYLKALIDSEDYTVRFNGSILTAEYPGDKEVTLYTEQVESVSFTVLDKVKDGYTDYIVFCTVECVNGESGSSFEYKFAVNPRIGESYTLAETSTESESESDPVEP